MWLNEGAEEGVVEGCEEWHFCCVCGYLRINCLRVNCSKFGYLRVGLCDRMWFVCVVRMLCV